MQWTTSSSSRRGARSTPTATVKVVLRPLFLDGLAFPLPCTHQFLLFALTINKYYHCRRTVKVDEMQKLVESMEQEFLEAKQVACSFVGLFVRFISLLRKKKRLQRRKYPQNSRRKHIIIKHVFYFKITQNVPLFE